MNGSTTMRTLLACLLLGLAGPGLAQEPPPEPEAPPAAEEQAAAEAGEAEEAEVPEIDVWSEEAMEEDDVFIPSERIRADSSISFPVDI